MTAGIVLVMREAEYHSHAALSSTGARKILDSPARFRWDMDHPQPSKDEFDLGTAVHAKVLGVGADTVAIPEDLLSANGSLSTKAAKEWVAEQRAAGITPETASAAAAVVRARAGDDTKQVLDMLGLAVAS